MRNIDEIFVSLVKPMPEKSVHKSNLNPDSANGNKINELSIGSRDLAGHPPGATGNRPISDASIGGSQMDFLRIVAADLAQKFGRGLILHPFLNGAESGKHPPSA